MDTQKKTCAFCLLLLENSLNSLARVCFVWKLCHKRPRYVFKRILRMLGFHQVNSLALDAAARKVPPNKDGRMDFPELCALVGFILQNEERGAYGGPIVGTAFDEPPKQPEAIEDVLAVICEPTFIAQFTSLGGAIDVAAVLPVIRVSHSSTEKYSRRILCVASSFFGSLSDVLPSNPSTSQFQKTTNETT